MVNKKILLFGAVIIILALAIYFTLFFSYNCKDKACFNGYQAECKRAKFINDAGDLIWLYNIQGRTDGRCEVEVEVLQVKQGDLSKKILEEKTMTCLLPFGSLATPEKDLSLCKGSLKEELQGLIIKELHTYIIENLGTINEELEKKL